MYFIYKFLTTISLPLYIMIVFLRKYLKKEDDLRFKEKFLSNYFFLKSKNELFWFHAASIGEFKSIVPIIKNLQLKKPEAEFLITTVTLSSGEIFKKEFEEIKNINHKYFPFDNILLVKKFLDKCKPNLAVFVDSEIWPNFIIEIKKRNIPLILLNGRITKKTFNRWKIVSNFASYIFGSFDLCLPSSKSSEINLKALLCKNIKYFGNLKFAADIEISELNKKNKEILENFKTWCAASTHPNEEVEILYTHKAIKKYHKDIVTIIIPRHIQRAEKILADSTKLNLKTQILKKNDIIEKDKEIIIVKSFGSLLKYYNYCNITFIGKSFQKIHEKIGGQNPIEAAKLGCKIYHGPYVSNFQEVYDYLAELKISFKVNDKEQLADEILNDFKHDRINSNENIKTINEKGNMIFNRYIRELQNFI